MSRRPELRPAVAEPARTASGARTELRLAAAEDSTARYEARWFLGADDPGDASGAAPDAHGWVKVDAVGGVTVEVTAGQVPAWVLSFTEKLLRTTARSAQDGRLPRRLTRWREGPA